MQLTRQQILELSAAFRRLDGERGKSYKFGAKTRGQLAQRIRRLAGPTEDLQDAQKKLFAEYGLTGAIKRVGDRGYPEDDPAKTRAYNLEWNNYLRESVDIQLGKFLLADLDLQNNGISVQVLAHLLSVISDVPTQPTTAIKLTLGDIHGAARAFSRLETETREFKASYQIKLNLAEIWRQLAAASDKAEIARQAMITERKLGNFRQNAEKVWEPSDDQAALKALETAWAELRATPRELTLPTVLVSQLDLETNDIPGSVLGDLLPVLVEDPVLATQDG